MWTTRSKARSAPGGWVWVIAALAMQLGACGPRAAHAPERSASFEIGLTQVCQVDRLAQLDPATDLIGIEGARYDWMLENVKDPDTIELITLMRVEAEKQRARMLREAMRGTQLKHCALASSYAEPAVFAPTASSTF